MENSNAQEGTVTPEELARREQAVALRERRMKAAELLKEHHLPLQVGDALMYDSDEALAQSIELAKTVMAHAKSAPETPKAPAPAVDRRQMTYTERAAMYRNQTGN